MPKMNLNKQQRQYNFGSNKNCGSIIDVATILINEKMDKMSFREKYLLLDILTRIEKKQQQISTQEHKYFYYTVRHMLDLCKTKN